jgi:hypothetical protein
MVRCISTRSRIAVACAAMSASVSKFTFSGAPPRAAPVSVAE